MSDAAGSSLSLLQTSRNPEGTHVHEKGRQPFLGWQKLTKGTMMTRNHQRRIISAQRIGQHLRRRSVTASQHQQPVDIHQFGVLTGGGLKAWLAILPRFTSYNGSGHVFGFDSFEGMPDEDASLKQPRNQKTKAWQAGGLNAAKMLNVTDWPTLRDVLTRNVGHPPEKTHFVRGFYNESLANAAAVARRLRMRPAFLIDIDSDIYTSAKQALRFVLDAGVLAPGTFVYYDDISEFERWTVQRRSSKPDCKDAPLSEELRAHQEISLEYGLSWRSLAPLGRYSGPVPGLDWILQRPASERGKVVPMYSYPPVLELISCGRCAALLGRER